MAIVTRRDLKLSIGKLAAQSAHAAVDCVLAAKKLEPKILERWRMNGARKIVVEAKDLPSLRRIYGAARESGLIAALISDAGHTEIPAGTVTVVAVGPAPRRSVDSIIGDLSLVK